MCITSLKGAAYFACSVHIADALFLLWTFIFDVIHVHKLWWYPPTPLLQVHDDPNLTWYFVIIGIYIFLAIILGFVIFRGIEVDSLRVTGIGSLAFLILQVIAFITTLCWWYPIPPHEDPYGLLESARIGRFAIRSVATIGYMFLLLLFLRRLRRMQELEASRDIVFGYRKPGRSGNAGMV